MVFLLILLLSLTATHAQQNDEHIFDTSIVMESSSGSTKILHVANLNAESILVSRSSSVELLKHKNLELIEDPMDKIWSFTLADSTSQITAGPIIHPSKNEFFVGDDQHRIYSINVETGIKNWMSDSLDPKILGGQMNIATHPNGRILMVSVGEHVMGLSVELGTVLFHRRVSGVGYVSTKFQFITPPIGQTASSFSPKCIFGDSTGTVHSIDTASGRKSWSWKFENSKGSIVDLLLVDGTHRDSRSGVGSIVAVNLIGDLGKWEFFFWYTN